MPTGYNEHVIDGTMGFRDYALRCAHAFVWETRDSGLDSTIPMPTFDTWRMKNLEHAKQELAEREAWTDEEWAEQERTEREEYNKHQREAESARDTARANVDRVMAKVQAYQPPTDKHENFKKFMIQQLQMAYEYEARAHDDRFDNELPMRDVAEYKVHKLQQLREYLQRAQEDYDKSVETYKENLRWRTQLMKSIEEAAR